MDKCDFLIIGSGPAGLGAAFFIKENSPNSSILLIDKEKFSSGGLRNDCKMNFTFPIGFPEEYWNEDQAKNYLKKVKKHLNPPSLSKENISIYSERAKKLGVKLLDIQQSHLGTDGGLILIKELISKLDDLGVEISLEEEMTQIDEKSAKVKTSKREIEYKSLIIAPGRRGFKFLQKIMDNLKIDYVDHVVDIGVRIETRIEHYPIVRDYYDPKFLFPDKVRTFCTNSGNAHVVQEKYTSSHNQTYYSINGHAYSANHKENGLVNFAMLKTIKFTEPLASGSQFAENLALQAMLLGGGHPIMQRVGDFRLGKRSKSFNFNGDLYNFKATLSGCTPGDITLTIPSKILRGIWKSMKLLDTIVPGILHPSTIIYYPEIKLYANKPNFINDHFKVKENIYIAGDGAGTSRGITAAWASGIRCAEGLLKY